MAIKCKLGIHNWDECVCTECNAIRSTHHDIRMDCEKCSKCGTEFPGYHDWGKNCERCARCGKTREFGHSWQDNCEKCSRCGETRKDEHKIVNGLCSVCGHGIFEDNDKKQYQVIRIGKSILMAENYAKQPLEGGYWIYEEESTNLAKYGYLYDFETALNIAPKGWHLPTRGEWEAVLTETGANSQNSYENLRTGGHSGFNAVFSGWRSNFNNFIGENESAHYWSNTEESEEKVWQFKIIAHDHKVGFDKTKKTLGLSVRYFKD